MKLVAIATFGLPRPATQERGEGWGEGLLSRALKQVITSSPPTIVAVAAPPFHGGEGVMRADTSRGVR